jgi:hypothetical protein
MGKVEIIYIISHFNQLTFEKNFFPSVKSIFMYNSSYDFSQFRTNTMPQLRNLNFVNCSLSNYDYQQ